MSRSADQKNWEASKENIQPLSGGRKMSSLTHSLERNDSMVDVDLVTQLTMDKLENNIATYTGLDPIYPWIQYIAFLQQNHLNENGKFAQKYKDAILRCLRMFLSNPLYSNDKRFAEIYIKGISSQPLDKRITLLKTVMERGVGRKVAKMYSTLAEYYEANSNNKLALDTVREGLKENGEPRELLDEHQKNLEFRMAAEIAKAFNEGEASTCRLFGADVKLGPCNEAPSVRIDLSPASASDTFPLSQQLNKMSIYKDDENVPPKYSFSGVSADPIREIEQIEAESENFINPTKWNARGAEMSQPLFQDLEKIELYVSSDEENYDIPESSRKLSATVLAERKLDEVAEFVEVKICMNPPQVPRPYPESKLIGETQVLTSKPAQPASTQHYLISQAHDLSRPYHVAAPIKFLANPKAVGTLFSNFNNESSSQSSGPNPVKPVTNTDYCNKKAASFSEVNPEKTSKKPGTDDDGAPLTHVLMYCKNKLIRGSRELTLEHLRSEAFFKKLSGAGRAEGSSEFGSLLKELNDLRQSFDCYKEETNKEIKDLRITVSQLRQSLEAVDLRIPVAQLRQSLEVVCSNLSNVITQTQNMAQEVEALKMKPRSEGESWARNVGASMRDTTSFTTAPIHLTTPEIPDEDNNMDIENMTVDVICKRQLLKYSDLSTFSRPYTTIETFHDLDGSVSNISIDVIPLPDVTEAVFNQHPARSMNFNTSNLTHALNFQPKPMHSSSPDKRGVGDNENELGNIHRISEPYLRRTHFNQTHQEVVQNLSTIQETSKESCSTTASSNSSNFTTLSATRNSSATLARSASKPGSYIRFQNYSHNN